MSETAAARPPSEARVPFGIPELDQMLDGGLMPHRPYLIVGPSGTGKTALALEFLCEGIRRGERCLYVTLEDPPNEVSWNHRALRPELDSIDVFDAIPDVMRYERAPFKDISAVRQVVPFGRVPPTIRSTPEFSSVEVTRSALEQILRSEVQRRGYSRLVVDSLTALQYFCMKGFEPTVGAQTFLRFLTELRTTTLLTVESPLEDLETPERMLARGEIRLFRWDLDGATVRAVGVEKFRGSAHDVRLHPYRIGPKGIDIQLGQTISRDTRQIVEPALTVALREEGAPAPAPVAPLPTAATVSEPLSQQIADLVTLGVDVSPLRSEVEAAVHALEAARAEEVSARMARISAMAISLAPVELGPRPTDSPGGTAAAQAAERVAARADRIREGVPPTRLPPADLLAKELATILAIVVALERHAPPATRKAAAPPAPGAHRGPGGPAAVPAPTPPEVTPGIPGPSVGMEADMNVAAPRVPPPPGVALPPEPEPPTIHPPQQERAAERPSGRRAPRSTARVAEAEPPPLPRVASLLAPPPPARLASVEPPGAEPSPAVAPAAPPVPAAHPPSAPRRRRKAPTEKPRGSGTPAPTSPAPAVQREASATVPPTKTRRRAARRKSAPTVVAAEAVVPPKDEAPAGTPASPAPEPPGSTEGT